MTAKFVGGVFGFSVIFFNFPFSISAIPNCEGLSTSQSKSWASEVEFLNFVT